MIQAPALLTEAHDRSAFSCNNFALDDWLRKRALPNQGLGASRTYVIANGIKVIGYYALAAGGVAAAGAPGKVKRNMPDPVPVMVLGRLAIDRHWQGRGLGADLLQDAVLRTMQAASIGGIRALMVHAKDERAAQFYRRHGFVDSPLQPLVLFLPLHPLPASA